MPAPTPVGSATTFNGSAATQATSFDAGWVPGDIAILSGTINSNTDTVNLPTGWTPHPDFAAGTGGGNFQPTTALTHFCFYRVLQAGDSAPTLANSGGVAKSWAGGIDIYRGADPANPIAAHGRANYSALNVIDAPAVTPPVDDCRLVCGWAITAGTTAGTGWTPPGSMTERFDVESSGTAKRPVASATEALSGGSGVSTGVRTGTSGATGSTANNAWTLAIAPQTTTTETLRPDAIILQTNDTKTLANLQRDVA